MLVMDHGGLADYIETEGPLALFPPTLSKFFHLISDLRPRRVQPHRVIPLLRMPPKSQNRFENRSRHMPRHLITQVPSNQRFSERLQLNHANETTPVLHSLLVFVMNPHRARRRLQASDT